MDAVFVHRAMRLMCFAGAAMVALQVGAQTKADCDGLPDAGTAAMPAS